MSPSYPSPRRYSFRFVMLMVAGVSSMLASAASFFGTTALGFVFLANAMLFFSLAYNEYEATN